MINFKKNLKKLKKSYNVSSLDIEKKNILKKYLLDQYEFSSKLPQYDKLIKLSYFFNISIDSLLLDSSNKFINNIELFKLCEHTNSFDTTIRNQIENNIFQYIDKNKQIDTKFDNSAKYVLTNSIHSNIKIIRLVNNISQLKLSEILKYKSPSSVGYIEKEKSKMKYTELEILSKKFNISIHYLITGEPLFFDIKDPFLLHDLIIFDKTASIENIKTITNLIKQIYKKNNISF